MDTFWLHNPKILIDTYLQFIPTKDMTINQKYNSITLFCIYFLILLIIFRRPLFWFYLPLITIIIIIFMFMIDNKEKNISNKENFNTITESGYIDSNGEMRFNRVTGQPTTGQDVTYTCRKPTKDNPFMNPPISDFNTTAPAACNSDDENINNSITKAFKSDLYMDVDDVFEKMNSQRQFYTVPNTSIPNQQTEFANWLYRIPQTCKEDQEQCLRYEDLRYKR
jgi:hypothetical protein